MTRRRLRRSPFVIVAAVAVAFTVLPRLADAALVSPQPTSTNPSNTRVGTVTVADNFFNSANVAQPCTSSVNNSSSKGITQIEVFQGESTAPEDRVLDGYFTNQLSGTTTFGTTTFPVNINGMSSTGNALAAFWVTDSAATNVVAPRGKYTIKPSYFKRVANNNAPCSVPTACTPSTVYGSLTNSGGACVDPVWLGAPESPASGAPVVVNIQNSVNVALTNAPASGPYLASDTNPLVTISARLTDPARSSSNNGAGGRDVVFKLAGGPNGDEIQTVTTTATGPAADIGKVSATFDTTGWSLGTHALTVSYPTDAIYNGASVTNAVKIGGASVTSYVSPVPAQVHWNDDLVTKAHVQGASGGVPEGCDPVNNPAACGTVKFTLGVPGTQVTQTVPLDANGDAVATLATGTVLPAAVPLKLEYSGNSDSTFLPSTATQTVTVLRRPTALALGGSTTAIYGEDMTFTADLTDATPGSAVSGAPLEGRTVSFKVGNGQPVNAITDAAGRASVTVPAWGEIGTVDVLAVYLGDPRYVESSATKPFTFDFRYLFTDATSPIQIKLNPGTHQFAYVDPPKTIGPITEPLMLSIFLPKNFSFTAPALQLPADYLHAMLAQAPGSPAQTIGGQSIGSVSGAVNRDPATFPLQIGGFTLGDLLNQVQAGRYPTDIDTCQALVGSECERRLVVMLYRSTGGFALPVSVFDVKTGLFVALANDGAPRLLYSFGTCLTDVLACIGYPLGLPLPPLPPLPPLTVPTSPPSIP